MKTNSLLGVCASASQLQPASIPGMVERQQERHQSPVYYIPQGRIALWDIEQQMWDTSVRYPFDWQFQFL
jgi:hypothetical protein